ncbi:MAG TPA: CDP-alcohol phosphatidyltransferase family protein [Thermoanaerobaculia bacterium]
MERVALSVPNLLSLFRMALVPLFVIAITRDAALEALLVFVVAGITDAFDGFVARFWNQKTALGAYLDPAADKLLLTSAYVTLTIESVNPALTIPLWVTILVIARDVAIVIAAFSLSMAVGIKSFPPALISKVTTVMQVVAVVLVLVHLVWPGEPLRTVATVAIYAVPVLTVASGLYYVRLFDRRLAEQRVGEPPGPRG